MLKNIGKNLQYLFQSEKKDNSFNYAFHETELTKRKLKKEINTLKTENEMLKDTIKDELYKTFMDKLGEPLEMERLRNDNKNLRKKIRTLKEIIKEDNSNKKGKNK